MSMKYFLSLFVVLYSCTGLAQYTGGDGDGFSTLTVEQTDYIFDGDDGDGFAFMSFEQTDDIFDGGDADGFATMYLEQSDFLFAGGDGDGFSSGKIAGNSTLYEGGLSDGFAYKNLYQKYIWTGTVGSGWNVTGNWSTNQIPSLRHSVTIPSGVPYYPAVNAGLLAIGKDPLDNSAFRCSNINLQAGANMTTRINCFVEVYGTFRVSGLLFVKNTAPTAFVVKANGELEILGGQAVMGAN